jgi:hypothetical protein
MSVAVLNTRVLVEIFTVVVNLIVYREELNIKQVGKYLNNNTFETKNRHEEKMWTYYFY